MRSINNEAGRAVLSAPDLLHPSPCFAIARTKSIWCGGRWVRVRFCVYGHLFGSDEKEEGHSHIARSTSLRQQNRRRQKGKKSTRASKVNGLLVLFLFLRTILIHLSHTLLHPPRTDSIRQASGLEHPATPPIRSYESTFKSRLRASAIVSITPSSSRHGERSK